MKHNAANPKQHQRNALKDDESSYPPRPISTTRSRIGFQTVELEINGMIKNPCEHIYSHVVTSRRTSHQLAFAFLENSREFTLYRMNGMGRKANARNPRRELAQPTPSLSYMTVAQSVNPAPNDDLMKPLPASTEAATSAYASGKSLRTELNSKKLPTAN